MFPFQDDVPLRRTPVVTYALIALNVFVFYSMLRAPEERREMSVYERGFIPARVGQFFDGRPLEIDVPVVAEVPVIGRIHLVEKIRLPPDRVRIASTLLTSMYMHGGWLHLLGNMWFLWLFGDNVEDRLGRAGYLAFYTFGGCAAMACHWMHDPASTVPVVGASGAIAAVLGAFLVAWPHARIRTLVFLFIFVTVLELPALLFLGLWFVMQIMDSMQPEAEGMGGGIAWWAHIGGFVVGAVTMYLLGGHEHHGTGPADDVPHNYLSEQGF